MPARRNQSKRYWLVKHVGPCAGPYTGIAIVAFASLTASSYNQTRPRQKGIWVPLRGVNSLGEDRSCSIACTARL